MTDTLFREEAVEAQRAGTLGTITLATPISRYYVAAAAVAVAAAIGAMLFLTSYTRRERIVGMLVRDPAGESRLKARFLVPTRATGFMTTGDSVLLRYHAYPYQKFGLHRGAIESIADSPLDSRTSIELGAPAGTGPMFLVDVAIAEQQIRIYDREVPLRAGLTLDADVMLDRRRLIEWLFEPIYGLRQRQVVDAP